jgi:predicted GIY-YIG superfamily endonuclease
MTSAPTRQHRMPSIFLYTLKLANGRWYVGTTKNPQKRLREHRAGLGAAWTRRYPPIGFSKLYPLEELRCNEEHARLQEDTQVKKVMLEESMDLVRGGSYSCLCLSREDIKTLSKELYHATDGCLRCGHRNHWAKSCNAVKDVAGNMIEDEEEESRKRVRNHFQGCKRCGRESHTEKRCYAKIDVNGKNLDDPQREEDSENSGESEDSEEREESEDEIYDY